MYVIVFFLLLAVVITPILLINLRSRNRGSQTAGSENGKANSGSTLSPLTFLTGAAALVLAVFLVLSLAWFCYAVFRWPGLVALREGDNLASLFANLAVVCYAFPAFIRTKNCAFLALGFAALTFAYGTLFSELLTSRATAPWRTTHSEAQWYFASRHIVSIMGLVLYACASVSLARSAKTPNEIALSPNS